MDSENKTILISICTYKRALLLDELLQSVFKEEKYSSFRVSILVIDNDSEKSAEALCRDGYGGFNLTYVSEPKRNISEVRNVGLQRAKDMGFDYILFLDDDEFVSENYFIQLENIVNDLQPDVVIGPVITLYHPDTPDWVIKSKSYERSRKKSGEVVDTGNTGNALVKVSSIMDIGLFNPVFGRTGGEDSEFFYRCKLHGLNMVWCDEAEVYEYLELQRCTLKYLLTRAIRGGQTYSRIRASDYSLVDKLKLVTMSIAVGLPSLALSSLIVLLTAKKKGTSLMKISIAKVAQIGGLFGKVVEMYGK